MEIENTASAPAPAADAPAPAPTTPAPEVAEKETPNDSRDQPEDALDADLRKAFRNSKRERAEDGKFATKDGRPPKTHNQPPEEVEAEQTAEAPQTEQPKTPAVPVPRGWTKEAAEKWAAVPPDVQQYVSQREDMLNRTAGEFGRYRQAVEPIRQVIDQNKHVFERNGADPANGIAALLAAQDMLDRNPVNALAYLAQTYGVDLRALAAQVYGGNDATGLAPDPEVAALQNKIAQLEHQLKYDVEQRNAAERAAVQQRQAQVRQSFEQRIDAFAKDKPDFDEVAPEILANIQAIQQLNPQATPDEVLNQAYERAVWANPKTRESRMKAEEAKRLQEAAKRAAEAKAAAGINVRGAPRPNTDAGNDLDADLRAAFRRAQNRS